MYSMPTWSRKSTKCKTETPRSREGRGVNSLCGRNQRQRYADLIIAQAMVFFKYPLGGNQSRWRRIALTGFAATRGTIEPQPRTKGRRVMALGRCKWK